MEKSLTTDESLQLISSMIRQAKQNYTKGGSFQFLLWGWTVMLCNLAHYGLEKFLDYPAPFMVWLATIPVSFVSAIYGSRLKSKLPVYTLVDKMYGHVWTAALIGIVIVLVFMGKLNYFQNPIILIISALGTYISGHLLRFKPSIFGGLALFVGAIICFNVSLTDQYLVGGISIFLGYLVPGYLLKRVEK